MKNKTIAFFIGCWAMMGYSQLAISPIAQLPTAVSNNAVCEGVINDTASVYSFAGIDSTKLYSGIHLKAFRFDTESGTITTLPDLPDTLGKIACAASCVDEVIYISGGYHVLANGHEVSSNKMHRFDLASQTYLSDGADIPVATDDHVQVVWRDSLIYLISGWSNTTNINDVQIYNPALDSWTAGTAVPNNNFYRSFGASGTIVGDTIYYFGGARSSFGFGIQSQLRKGVIDPNDPSQITWSYEIPDPTINGYRMAATTVKHTIHWIGGSTVTYNYDGIAYNGSGGVPPANRDLYTDVNQLAWSSDVLTEIPMDLRGIASINDSVKYIVGGMIANQTVTNRIYKLEWDCTFLNQIEATSTETVIKAYPNPFIDQLIVELNVDGGKLDQLELFDVNGRQILTIAQIDQSLKLNTEKLTAGLYFLRYSGTEGTYAIKLIK